jgi:hypothetical protein
VQGCRVAVFDAGNAAASVAFPHVLVEFERPVAAPFIVLQVRGFEKRLFGRGLDMRTRAANAAAQDYLLACCRDGVWLQGVLHGEMGREKFPVELSTFQTFGLTALQQQVYALSLSLSRSCVAASVFGA